MNGIVARTQTTQEKGEGTRYNKIHKIQASLSTLSILLEWCVDGEQGAMILGRDLAV